MVDLVTTLTGEHLAELSRARHTAIVEIVGPAGAGKTTLFRAIETLDLGIQTEFLPPVWDFRYAPFFVKHILSLSPTLARLQGKVSRSLTRRELAWMAMLVGWPEILMKKTEDASKDIILDQGPIFLMAILSEFGPESLRSSNIQAYWDGIIERWAQTLDIVIWLDASDEILIERVRNRQDDHLVKNEPDQKIKAFLAKYRAEYARLIGALTAKNPGLRVLALNTGMHSKGELVSMVIDFIHAREMEAGTDGSI